MEIIESADTRAVADRKAGKDGMEMFLFQVSRLLCIGSDLALHRELGGAEHVRGKPWNRTEVEITVSQEGVHIREVKVPELLHNLPGGSRQRGDSIRIVFT